jgi:hypothetical protein
MENIRIRDVKIFGSGINIPEPQHWVALAQVRNALAFPDRIRMGTADLDPGAMKLPLFTLIFIPFNNVLYLRWYSMFQNLIDIFKKWKEEMQHFTTSVIAKHGSGSGSKLR